MPIPIPPTEYPILIELIDEVYTDRVDRIVNAEIDNDDNIICIAQDGPKQIAVKIDATSVQIKLLIPTEAKSAAFSEAADPIAPIVSQLKPIGDSTFQDWFTELQSLMQDSDNLTDFQGKLAKAYPHLDAAEFKQAMLDASTLAGMQGYSDADSHN